MKSWYNAYNIRSVVFDFDQEIAAYYAAADVVICRSGSGSLFEVLFFNKTCITIPLETPTNKHQLANARAMINEHDQLFTMIRQKTIEQHKEQFHTVLNQLIKMPIQESEYRDAKEIA